jgi:hypothetical protein
MPTLKCADESENQRTMSVGLDVVGFAGIPVGDSGDCHNLNTESRRSVFSNKLNWRFDKKPIKTGCEKHVGRTELDLDGQQASTLAFNAAKLAKVSGWSDRLAQGKLEFH